MRLAGGVPEHRLALGEDGRHDRVLRAHHRRLVEVHARAAEPVRGELVDAVDVDSAPSAENACTCVSRRRRPIRRLPAAARSPARSGRVAARRAGTTPVSRVRARVEVRPPYAGRVDRTCSARSTRRPRRVPRAARPWSPRRGSVARSRAALVGSENGGREDRQCAVLVPRRAHGPVERAAAFDDEGLHRAGNATGGLTACSSEAHRQIGSISRLRDGSGSNPRTCA